ncbi:NAD-dependent epimerase/dehydratase family protein [Kribbella turkmenica]|uniref:NAD-dependent epimerase/dehydratase family protein n=1 Tax=Kribbella turkmenica TaxID=2530375 RepID=A0A4R4XGG3_9ACTN|nr:NAD(P)H-binding protein [Kribbella turkmenica]TDD29840.1 NAD-dependent epimerase/dehydratase family protein [Kribbella turkmenica]
MLVTGGTGTLGRQVVPLVRAAGWKVRVLSRHAKDRGDGVEYVAADLLQDDRLDAAVAGVDVMMHLAGGPKGDDVGTRNLVRAAERAGVKHLVHISVTAVDQLPLGYFKAKLGAEQAVRASSVPWTVVRAAQFHDFTLKTVQAMAKLPVLPVPGGLRLQPVDARDVAERLVELALGEPAGLVPDLVGPKVYSLGELARGYLQATGKRRLSIPVRVPGKAGKVYRAGGNLTLSGADVGTRTWEAFLAAQTERASATALER